MPEGPLPRSPELKPLLVSPEQPEAGFESAPERRGPPPVPEQTNQAVPVPTPAAGVALPPRPARDIPQLQRAVESILEEGLAGIYQELTPTERTKFRATGEQTAARIAELIKQVRVKVNDILRLIREWLSSIPGVNRYFLEQEAKIKADKVLKLHEPR